MILGASFDTPEENRAFKDKFDFPFDLLCDVERSAGISYGAAESADAEYAARVSCLVDPRAEWPGSTVASPRPHIPARY